jgi:hypothetical protein
MNTVATYKPPNHALQQTVVRSTQPLFSKSKFALSVEGSVITASLQLTLDVCKCMKRKKDGLFDRDTRYPGVCERLAPNIKTIANVSRTPRH